MGACDSGCGSRLLCWKSPVSTPRLSIYVDKLLNPEDLEWPLKAVVPEIEDLYSEGKEVAEKRLLEVLAEDYASETPDEEVKKRAWYGRCVYESDNDVCDDQIVTIAWDDDPLPITSLQNAPVGENGTNGVVIGDVGGLNGRAAKAIFHMIASTEKICERRGRIYGTTGEISYDSDTITVHSFATGETVTHPTSVAGKGHGGGDESMAGNFCRAVQAVVSGEMEAEEAQRVWLGCGIEEIVRSHVAVFAAERARVASQSVIS